MTDRLDIRLLHDGDTLRVWFHQGTGDRLTVSFSGIGIEGQDPGYEFARTATQSGRDHALFIADKSRSWLNAPGLIDDIAQWIEASRLETGARDVMTLGHSMGGFAALAMPKYVPVTCAVGLSPQTSVHPEVAGDDPRWMDYRSRIKQFVIRDLSDTLVPGTAYYAVHGRHPREAPQRDRFPRADNLVHLILPRTVHNVPQKLRDAGILEEAVEQAFLNRPRRFRLALAGLEAYRRPPADPQFAGAAP